MSTLGAAPAPILTDAELRLLQALVYQECGMHFDERRTHFLQDRLLRRLKECRADSFYAYYRLLISQEGKTELARLVENLTVNETSFFRHKAQLDLFQKHVLEELLKRKQAHREYSVRVWSAGCSTGQEGFYNEHQMSSVDYSFRLRYFDKVGDRYAVKKALKEMVHFDFHNLKTEYLPQRNDVIFCRNVMMYFDEAEQKRLIEKFYRCLNPDGYLFVGHAESLLGLTEKFHMVHRDSGTAYQRIEVRK